MASIDFSNVTSDMAQLQALEQQLSVSTDPTVKAVLQTQIASLQARVQVELQQAQHSADSTSNMLNQLGLMSAFQSLGSAVPGIIALFK